MIRKAFSLALMCLMGLFALSAQAQQMPQPQQLPLMPGVKSGVLPNGLSYYIMHNAEPKERAFFYIAQKVGSTLENQDQLGLAHFLEHMAFNGTKNFPGKNMLNYLQSKGIRFGADINAYTAFDETVYNIDNVPTTDKALMDSVLLVLHDWSGSILLEESEINAERGVIQEEWRQRNGVSIRMMNQVLPKIYEEYQYHQMPIGSMDVVMNFKPETLRAYYKKWYRPDQQGIVIVGDFDAAEMEKKVIDLFSKIPMPENAAPREYPTVSNNEKPIFVTFSDPEQQYTMATICFKYDKTPFEMRNTDMGYQLDAILRPLISQLINTRLSERAQEADCPYAYAGCGFGDYYVSKTKGAFQISVVAKDNMEKAMNDAMAVVARALKTGFTPSEVERARDKILASLEKQVNEKDKTNSRAFCKELVRHFVDNEPAPGIESEYEIQKMLLNALPVDQLNALAAQLVQPTNEVIVVCAPEGQEMITETVAVNTVNNAFTAQYEAMKDEAITEPLIAKLPKAGKIKKTEANATLGTTEFTLSNGAKVIVKPTDFANDQIIFEAYSNGGKRSYSEAQAANVLMMGDAFALSKKGPFDVKTFPKYMAGKQATIGLEIANVTNILKGQSTVKDLPVLMQLIYTAFTGITPDEEAYNNAVAQAITFMKNQELNPEFIFKQKEAAVIYGNNPLQMEMTAKTLEQANYLETLNMVKQVLSNAADFTFIFVGNVDTESIKPMLEQYIASLPSKKKPGKVAELSSIAMVKGIVNDDTTAKAVTPSVMVSDVYSNSGLDYTTGNTIMLSMLGQVLDMNYVATLREEEGGTYGASAYAYMNPNTGMWHIAYSFQTNADMQKKLRDRAYKELVELVEKGAPEDYFNKVREAMLKQQDLRDRNNGYWANYIMSAARGLDCYTGSREFIQNLTLADFNAFMKTLNINENHIDIVVTFQSEK